MSELNRAALEHIIACGPSKNMAETLEWVAEKNLAEAKEDFARAKAALDAAARRVGQAEAELRAKTNGAENREARQRRAQMF